jgi:hypothetical protein
LSFVDVQQRWQMLPLETLLSSVFPALPASIRKPWEGMSVTGLSIWMRQKGGGPRNRSNLLVQRPSSCR